jgi:hypothetical protein
MTTVSDLQKAILALSESEYAELRRWMVDEDWERWEREFDEDVKAGLLDELAADALKARDEGDVRPL